MLKDNEIKDIYKQVEEYEKKTGGWCYHNYNHIMNVTKIVVYILKELNFNEEDIAKGKIKLRKKGGPGSHNGMKSVIQELGITDFTRIRVGIGQPEFKSDMINYVIGKVPEEEQKILQEGTQKAAEAVEEIIKNGIDIAMNKFN